MKATAGLTTRRLLDRLSQTELAYYVLGRTAFEKEIFCVELGGTKEPPIVITAGSHATEWAGPLAALGLLSTLRTEHKVYLVPCRDPLGLDGFGPCLTEATGVAASLASMDDLRTLIDHHGEIVYDHGGVQIATFDHIGSIVVDESQTRQFVVEQHLLPEMVPTRADLIERLGGRYLFFVEPWENGTYGWEGGPFEHPAQVLFVSRNGAVGNLNRFFNRDDGPIEVACIRDLVDQVKPGLLLDLHEGFGDKFYLIVPLSEDPLQDRVARAMTTAVRDRDFELSTFGELAPRWGPKLTAAFRDLGDGIYSGEHMTSAISLGSYGRRYGATATVEAGMEAPIEQRVNFIEWATRAGIRAYEAHHQ